jgi:hypothetical protein
MEQRMERLGSNFIAWLARNNIPIRDVESEPTSIRLEDIYADHYLSVEIGKMSAIISINVLDHWYDNGREAIGIEVGKKWNELCRKIIKNVV